MKRKILLYILFPVLLIFFAGATFYTLYNKNEQRKEKNTDYFLSDSAKNLLQSGDIILRYGHGLVSDYIVHKLDEPYTLSHCGIICKTADKAAVIHSESSSYFSEEGIQKQNLDSFVNASHKYSVIVVRYKQCNQAERTKISNRAVYYLNKDIPFDYAFNPDDTTKMFCSEIIWHVFKDAFDKDIFLNDKKETDFMQFRNFYDTTQFEVIINEQQKHSISFR